MEKKPDIKKKVRDKDSRVLRTLPVVYRMEMLKSSNSVKATNACGIADLGLNKYIGKDAGVAKDRDGQPTAEDKGNGAKGMPR